MASKKYKKEVQDDIIAEENLTTASKADTTDCIDDVVEQPAIDVATAVVVTDFAETVVEADKLNITDYNMVSNEIARKILESKGKTVMFEEPEDVKSNYYMKPIG